MAAGLHQAGDAQGQFINSGFQILILERQHFTLFGDLDVAVHGARRLRQNRVMNRATAASHRAAAPVEQPATETVRCGERRRLLLRLIQPPVGSQNAAVLAGIGVADHHVLHPTSSGQQFPISRLIQ